MTRIVVWSTLALIEYDEAPVFFLHRLRGKRGFIPPRSRRCKGRVCFIHVTGKLGRRNSMKTPEPEDLPVIGNLHLCYERWQSVGLFHKISIFCSNYSAVHYPARCWLAVASQSRNIQAKIPSPKAIFNGFLPVTVRVLNSYVL